MKKALTSWVIIFSFLITICAHPQGEAQDSDSPDSDEDNIHRCLDKEGTELEQCLKDNAYEGNLIVSWMILLVTSLGAPLLLSFCFKTPDVWAFTAGAAAWFIGEVLTWDRYSGGTKHILETLKDSDGRKQVETLKAAYKHSQKGAKALEEKATWAMIAGIAYGAAAVLVGIKILTSPAGAMPFCAGCSPSTPSPKDPFITFLEGLALPSALAKDEDEDKDEGDEEIEKKIEDKKNEEMIGKLAAIGIGGGVAAVLILAFPKPVWDVVKLDVARLIFYLVTAGAAFIAMIELKEAQEKLKREAKTYAAIADKLVKAGADSGQFFSSLEHESGGPGVRVPLPPPLPGGGHVPVEKGGRPTCTTTNLQNQVSLDPTCSCYPHCQGPKVSKGTLQNIPLSGARTRLDSIVSKALDTVQSASTSAANGDLHGAKAQADKGKQYAAKLKKAQSLLQKKINEKRKKKGKKPIPFKALKEKFFKGLRGKLKRSLASLGPKDRNSLPNFGGMSKKLSEKLEKHGGPPPLNLGIVPEVASLGHPAKGVGSNLNFKLDDGDLGPDNDNQDFDFGQEQDQGIEKYEDIVSDITKLSEVSLFQVISIRYKRSAYPIFFKRKKKK